MAHGAAKQERIQFYEPFCISQFLLSPHSAFLLRYGKIFPLTNHAGHDKSELPQCNITCIDVVAETAWSTDPDVQCHLAAASAEVGQEVSNGLHADNHWIDRPVSQSQHNPGCVCVQRIREKPQVRTLQISVNLNNNYLL